MSQISSAEAKETNTTPETTQSGQSTASPGSSPDGFAGNNYISPFGPQPQFQLNTRRIYEQEFNGGAYVSAHLERFQRGLYKVPNQVGIDKQDPLSLEVALVAVRFVFHACYSAKHRITSAVISINLSAPGPGPQPKILKYAPHLAFGRISSSDLKWQFQLGLSVGAAQPAQASVNSQGSYEKDVVRQSMMTIQGSSQTAAKKDTPAGVDIVDGKMIWSLEENRDQKSGIPRECTFVFLLHQPKANDQRIHMSLNIRPSVSWSLNWRRASQRCVLDREIGQSFIACLPRTSAGKPAIAPKDFDFACMDDLEDLIELPGTIRKSQPQASTST